MPSETLRRKAREQRDRAGTTTIPPGGLEVDDLIRGLPPSESLQWPGVDRDPRTSESPAHLRDRRRYFRSVVYFVEAKANKDLDPVRVFCYACGAIIDRNPWRVVSTHTKEHGEHEILEPAILGGGRLLDATGKAAAACRCRAGELQRRSGALPAGGSASDFEESQRWFHRYHLEGRKSSGIGRDFIGHLTDYLDNIRMSTPRVMTVGGKAANDADLAAQFNAATSIPKIARAIDWLRENGHAAPVDELLAIYGRELSRAIEGDSDALGRYQEAVAVVATRARKLYREANR